MNSMREYLSLNEDLEAKEFKENFFYHFDRRETFWIGVALALGGGTYFFARMSGLQGELVTGLMAVMSICPLLIGFFRKQGMGILDYCRKALLVRCCREMVWESTEDSGMIQQVRGRRMKANELRKND